MHFSHPGLYTILTIANLLSHAKGQLTPSSGLGFLFVTNELGGSNGWLDKNGQWTRNDGQAATFVTGQSGGQGTSNGAFIGPPPDTDPYGPVYQLLVDASGLLKSANNSADAVTWSGFQKSGDPAYYNLTCNGNPPGGSVWYTSASIPSTGSGGASQAIYSTQGPDRTKKVYLAWGLVVGS